VFVSSLHLVFQCLKGVALLDYFSNFGFDFIETLHCALMHRYQYNISLACCFLICMHFQFLRLNKSTLKKSQEKHTHTQFARVELLSFATKSVLVCLVSKDLIEFFGLSFMIDDDCELVSFFYKIYK
jgi:hypothetical protein